MTAYYNEVDPYAAAWLRNLIAAGHIAPGEVDERSIEDVRPVDLIGYTQCHFFAGIGVWSYALRRAGWRDDEPVWTGSCPCQPFSAAGKRGGAADERHLWPHWFHLIGAAKPRGVPVLGEQVASKDGLAWLDLVHADLEGAGYTVGAVDLCAAGVGAPHIRQRLYFVADSDGSRCGEGRSGEAGDGRGSARLESSGLRVAGVGSVDHPADARRNDSREHGSGSPLQPARPVESGVAGGCGEGVALGDAHDEGSQGRGVHAERAGELPARPASVVGAAAGVVGIADNDGHHRPKAHQAEQGGDGQEGRLHLGADATAGFWRDADWLPCIDGKARPVEPGTFPLAHGAPARVGRLRAYGNAIVAPQAEEFIRAYMTSATLKGNE